MLWQCVSYANIVKLFPIIWQGQDLFIVLPAFQNSKENPSSTGIKYTERWKICMFLTKIAVYLENSMIRL